MEVTMSDFEQKSILGEIQDRVRNEFVQNLDALVVEGLVKKGFEFSTHDELSDFVANRCSMDDCQGMPYKYCYVDGEPFFVICDEMRIAPDKNNPGFVKCGLQYAFI